MSLTPIFKFIQQKFVRYTVEHFRKVTHCEKRTLTLLKTNHSIFHDVKQSLYCRYVLSKTIQWCGMQELISRERHFPLNFREKNVFSQKPIIWVWDINFTPKESSVGTTYKQPIFYNELLKYKYHITGIITFWSVTNKVSQENLKTYLSYCD